MMRAAAPRVLARLSAAATMVAAFALAAVPAGATAAGRGVVEDGHARFEVLTPTLIRSEYADDGRFEDGATFNAVNRDFAPVPYTTRVNDGWREIRTSRLLLRYREGSGAFGPDNLEIHLRAGDRDVVAHPTWQQAVCTFGKVCEAEDADLTGGTGVATDHQGYNGTGFVAGYQRTGAAATFAVAGVPADGDYTLAIRYANNPANSGDGGACVPRTLSVKVDGEDVGTATLDSTGSWDTWAIYRMSVPLRAGDDRLALAQDADDCGNVNVDDISLTRPGDPLPDPAPPAHSSNLGGWYRGLDGRGEPVDMHDGLLSRDGWYLLDDSRTALTTDDGWVKPRPDHDGIYQDGYLFGYGHDYARGLRDLAELTGPAPLLPKWAFGNWYSRYYPYTTADYEQRLLPRFRSERVPLDVLVVDTDFKAPTNWNGWNWNPDLFPDPEGFLRWAHGQGLHVTLNIHPSVDQRDPQYAKAQSLAGGSLIHGSCFSGPDCWFWDWGNRDHAASYFALHKPFEQQGVDFWWLDWCCEPSRVTMPGVTPDSWINSLYARDTSGPDRRGFAFSRIGSSYQDYGGTYPSGPWAEHRYSAHFTGDTSGTWDMLGFESAFTIQEGNIGLPYVTHDIGSFNGGHLADDMYVRWVQLGTFQPLLRLHSNHADRLPWEYDDSARVPAEKFLRLREALVPYLYTVARRSHDTGEPMVRGLYLDYPEHDEAYSFDREYMLGDQVLVAPVGTPGNVATTKVWFPPGTWVDYFTGRVYRGSSTQTIATPLDRMPVFVKAGGIVPEQPYMEHVGSDRDAPLIVRTWSGADGAFSLYDDAGDGQGYRHGEYSWTPITHGYHGNGGRETITVGPARGSYPGQPRERSYEVQLADTRRPHAVRVGHRGLREVRPGTAEGWWYDEASRTVHVRLGARSIRDAVHVAIMGGKTEQPDVGPTADATVTAPRAFTAGQPGRVQATFTNYGPEDADGVRLSPSLPDGWQAQPVGPTTFASVAPGDSVTAAWDVTPAAPDGPVQQVTIGTEARYTWGSGATSGSVSGQRTAYLVAPVQPPFETTSSTEAYFGQSGGDFGIVAGGSDIWTGVDEYGAIYRHGAAGADSQAVVRVDSQDDTDQWAKAGLVMRNDMTGARSSPGYVALVVTPGNGVQFAWDSDGNGDLNADVHTGGGTASAPVWLKLVRSGTSYTAYYSADGQSWTEVGTANVSSAAATQDVGMIATAHATGALGAARFSGFAVTGGGA